MTACDICESLDAVSVLEREGVPRSGQFLYSANETFATATLKWTGCRACGALALDQSRLGSVDYTHVVRGTHSQLPAYKDELIAMVQAAVRDAGGGSVIEVGANDGTFLNLLRQKGVMRLFAVEPSLAFNSVFEEAGIPCINRHLNLESALNIREQAGPAAMVICRHTLEHVPRPLEFLAGIRALLGDGRSQALIEVPDARSLAAQALLHELWDEHLYYFSEPNLRLLFARSGLVVREVRRYQHRGSEHLLVLVSPADSVVVKPEIQPDVDPVRLSERIVALLTHVRDSGSQWRRPLAALGASHPQSNYLSLSGAASFVDMLVDDDPAKIGRFVPVHGQTPLPVVSTQTLLEASGAASLLLTAFGYPGWVRRIQASSPRQLALIEPYAVE